MSKVVTNSESLEEDDFLEEEENLDEDILDSEHGELEPESEELEEDSEKTIIDEDDEAMLLGDDKILTEEDAYAIFKQSENVVSWSLENFYDELGERKSKNKLRANPPIFKIEASSGQYAEFAVTKEMATSLARKFDEVRRGYFGIDKGKPFDSDLSQKGFKKWVDSQKEKIKEKPVSTLAPFALIIIVIILLTIS